jgi:outer membrane protein OmpA-like peptidoglycan-associated protein/opacity protein-like surface antigen
MRGRRIVGTLALLLAPLAVLAMSSPAQADDASAMASSLPQKGFQLELGVFGGAHIFAKDLELGVADMAGTPHPKLGAEFGVRVAATMLPWLSLEGEVAGIPSADSIHNYRLYLATYKLHVLVHLLHGPLRPFVLAGVDWMQVASAQPSPGPTEIAPDTDFGFHAGVGVKYAVTDKIDLRADARLLFAPNTGHNTDSIDWEFLGGAAYRFGGETSAPPPSAPPLVKDTDRDDIPDNIDKCPNEPEDKDGFQDEDGCPDPDNDADGIPDATDKCPNEAEDKDGFQDEDGCPDLDNDADGIPDATDKCPDEAEDKDGFQDEDGCPDPDNDGDGVLDAQDKCPTEQETHNGYQDEDGCPDELPAAVKKFTGVIKGINFKVKSADIQKSSFKLLNNAVKVMKDYPDLRMEIAGHTSSEGVAAKNLKLSQDRAASVKAYFVAQGIAEARLTTIGYGSDKPIADNKTTKGREQNRRIEFRLLTSADAAPAGAADGSAPAPAAPGSTAPSAATKAPAPELKLPPAGEPMPAK